jgi:CheY-like chemotaxis protein
MSPEVQRRALEPFFTTKGFHSTGLGLSVNYGIVRRHGGDLTIESAVDQGTRVRFTLPIVAPPPPTPRPAATMPAPSPLRILLIDDEVEVRRVVSDMLVSQGHEIVEAASGADGLAALERDASFDLVLTDLGMPGMTGWDVARAAKAMRPDLQVGLITGWGELPTAKPEDRAAADFVLAKPITVDGLGAAIAAGPGTADPSPVPLTPSGLSGDGASQLATPIAGTSSARGGAYSIIVPVNTCPVAS